MMQVRLLTLFFVLFVHVAYSKISGDSPAVSKTAPASVTLDAVPDEVEFQALKAIYDSLGGANWTNNTNWPTPGNWPATATAAEMDTWYAVTVTDGDITAITLNQNNLSGIIPRTITNLLKLKNLSLQSNQITGTIPPSIGSLTDLTILYLSVNNMNGTVPAGIGNLINLATLSIYSNSFSGAIPASLNNLTNLSTLLIGSNQFSGDVPELGALTKLTSLGMESCPQLNSGPIPSWLQNCPDLASINISATNRTGAIPGFIGGLSKLTYFNASVNQLSGSIPSSLGNLSLLARLYLSNNQLTGTIPQELGSLTNLLFLSLASNQLMGPIPASLGNLTKLKELLIHSNQFTGPIPAALGNLPDLVYLYLFSNQLSGAIPSELGNLSNLRRLYISNNQLSGTVPPSLGNLAQLQNLWLQDNVLTGTVPETFSGLSALSQLNISSNQFTGPLPDIFSSLTNLSILNLSTNAFSGAFPASVSNCPMLTDISALNNNFTSLPASLLTLPAITRFNFNGNDLVSIPDFSNQVNKANLSLYVQNNRLDFAQLEPLINNGIMAVGSPLTQDNISDFSTVPLNSSYELIINARPTGQFSTVTWERQRVNGTWENVTALNEDATGQTFRLTSGLSQVGKVYRWRMTNTKVTGVTLNSSNITVTIGEGTVPDQLEFDALKAFYDSLGGSGWTTKTNWPTPGNWPATAPATQMGTWFGVTVTNGDVTAISMTNNNLTGKVPASISQLSKLLTLSLITNKITVIPSSLCSLSNLSTLYLSSNLMEGTVPACINTMTALQYLNLGNNKFTGAMPDLSALTSLKQLNLSSNTFTEGPIPAWIGSFASLEHLDLGGTVRNGSIPETFASLTSMRQLMMQSNKITGTIPSFLGNLAQLTHLYLHGNQLTGSIPSSLGNLSHLQILFLQFNQLSGNIPETLGNLSDLVYLHLGTNQLTGPIPASFNSLTKLNWLVLSANQLNGDIPNLGALTNLLQLSISVNAFNVGPIPSWIGGLTKLQILELAQTNRNGAFPEMLGTLSFMKELRVNSNQLTGSIPANIGSLTQLAYLSVNSNNLTGAVPSLEACTALLQLRGDLNQFTSIPSSLLSLPALNYVNFEGNALTSIPNFASHPNKAALNLRVLSNYLDFSHLEPLVNAGISQAVYTPQKTINDFTSVPLSVTNVLTINARPKGQFSTVTWERQLANGTWENVNALNEDATGQTFKRANGLPELGKTYRWKMTNTSVTGFTLASEPILVRVTEGLVPDDLEFAALKALYDSLGGPNWTNKTGWPDPGYWPATATAAQMDAWYGIAASNGDVLEITMPTNNLTGRMPAAVGNLASLTRLLLQDNKISGRLPATISNLQKLKFLYLQTNQLSGNIPASLSAVTSLEFLAMGRNQFTGDIPDLGALTNLKLLFLNDNPFNEGPIPGWISMFTSLGQLDLSSTKRNGPIPLFITSFQNLTVLSLSGNKLTGEIPPSLGQLSLLSSLYLNTNQLTGEIPVSLSNLSQLTHLYLSGNQLTGTIPQELGNLNKVVYLTLGTNQLTGTIPASLGNLTKLQGLYINNNFLTGSIPASFGNLAELAYLHLHKNQLSGSIPSELGNLRKLLELYIHQNSLSGELPLSLSDVTTLKYFQAQSNQLTGTIPASFSNLTNLVQLYLSSNQFSGALPEIFGSMTKLTSLDLSTNNFTGAFPTSIGSCVLLFYFRGDLNKFTSLPASVLTLPAVTSINFEGSELKSIPDLSGQANKANLTLTVKSNRLDFSQLEPLINAGISLVVYNPQKTINDFSSVQLSPGNILTIPARPKGQFSTVIWERQLANGTWENVTSLNEDATGQTFKLTNGLPQVGKNYRWKMTNTKVTGVTLMSDPVLVKETEGHVPDNIEFAVLKEFYDSLNGPNWTTKTNWPAAGNWPATATASQMGTWYGVQVTNGDVTQIAYVGNNISGKLPASIGNLGSLKVLQINGSSLKGPLPATLNQLTSLTYLMIISQPLLTGAIPDMPALTSLGTFSLANCPNLTPGPIPEWLGTFPLLTRINLSGSKRTGSIPTNLGGLSNLTELLLQSNQLSGPIPASLGGLANVVTVNLSGNQLSGTIPSNLGNLPKVVSLYLNNNQLSGSIPTEIGNLATVQYLHLSYNALTGPIPTAITNLGNLLELGLYSNQLSGSIPGSLDNLTNLTLLNLGNNQLSGAIPSSLCNLSKLVSLYLEINQLTGTIPTNIDNLTKLQVLSARSNQLTGTIPASITNMTTLKVLNLGSNQLTGSIPENIGNLTALTQLYLDVNQLTGPIPSGVGGLSNLGYLYLASNQLSGPLPASLASLTGMQYLNISNNQLTGEIPAGLSNFSNVKLFWIGSNTFSGTLPSNLFASWSQVTSLFVNNNNFSGVFPEAGSCVVLVDLRAHMNKFTGLPSSMLNLPAATTINFENNELTTIPNFSNHVNKANLGLLLHQNRLDLGSLEPLFSGPGTTPIKTLTYNSQKPFNEITNLVIPRGHPLSIQARDPGQHGTIVWEYRVNTSAAWTSINAQNEDATQRTLRISNFTSSRNGQYRYSMTSTWVTGATLRSVEMNISAGDYPVEWVKLKNVTTNNGALAKTAPDGWNRAGADASNILPALTNGWIEFVTTSAPGNYIIGLATSDKLDQGSALYGININNGDVHTGENGTFIAAGTQQPGDVFRISREGSQVRYLKNGTEIRSVTIVPSLALKVKALIQSGASPKVLASFDVKPILVPLFTPVNPFGVGGVTVTTDFGKTPYSYTWSEGTSGAAISGKPVGIYTVTSADANGRIVSAPYDLGYPVSWTDRLQVNTVDGGLKKTAPDGWGNAGANAANILKGGDDGWLSFVADTTAGAYMIGFATNDHDFDDQSLVQGIFVDENNFVYLAQSGAALIPVGSKVAGDVFRVLRSGTAVTYYRNGQLLGTSTVNPILSLRIKSVLKTGSSPQVLASFDPKPVLNATITPVQANGSGGGIAITASGGEAPYTYAWSTGATGAMLSNQPAGTYTVTVTDAAGRSVVRPYDLGYQSRWSALKNTNETSGALKKTVAAGWGNGGAVSANHLRSNEDGWISFMADTTSGAYVLGFATEDHQFSNGKVLHGFYITVDNHLYITEAGTSTLVGAKVAGDVFRIARTGDQVRYYRNGTELRASATEPLLELRIKSSLYTGTSPRVLASFDVKPWIAVAVMPLNAAGTSGAMTATGLYAEAPYSYQWSPGTTSQALSGQLMGTYAMTVTDAAGRTSTRSYDLGFKPAWKDLTNVNEVNGRLVKTVAGEGWGNGAISANRLYDLENGWISFVADTTVGAYAVGFATDTTTFSDAGIAQGFHVTADNFIYLIDAGVSTLIGSKIPGDVFHIARTDAQVTLRKNGIVLKTVAVDRNLTLRIMTAVHAGTGPQVLTSFEAPGSAADGYKVRWVDISGATEANGILTKQGNPGRGNGAHSANLLRANEDGWLEFGIFQSTGRYTIGFSTYAGPYKPHTANYSFSVDRGDTLAVYENGSDSIAVATWQVGDKLRIERAGDQVIYYRNGQEVRRVSVDPATELRVRAVIEEGMSPAVFVSSGIRLTVLAKTITPVKVNGTGGGVAVQPVHGKAPYTYQWSGGETTDAIANKNAGVYTVTVEDARGVEQSVPYSLGFKASWTDLTLVFNNNGRLSKHVTAGHAWNGGANSFNLLDAGQDGWIEFAIDTGASNYIIGFSSNSAGFVQERIDYGLSVIDGQKIGAYEKNSIGIPLSSWQPGDVLKIWRKDNTVKYYRNGEELRSVTTDPEKQYRVKATVYSGAVPPVSVSFDVPLILQANFTPVKSYGLAGAIAIAPVTGTPPFTYSWVGGETSQSITEKGIGTYSVNVTDAEGRTASGTYDLGYKVFWKDFANAADNNGALVKSTIDGSIAGANSVNVLKANEDGWLQFTVDNANSHVSVGFATYSGVFNTAAIDYALTVKPGEPVMTSEGDWTGVNVGQWHLGDAYKIARAGTQLTYYRNGTAMRTITVDPSKELVIKAAVYNDRLSMMQTSIPVDDRVATPIDETTVTYKIPKGVKITRDGRLPVAAAGPPDLFLSEVTAGETRPVFPGCPSGNYYVGFQLLYDLGDLNTTEDWSAFVQITMFHNEDSLWTRPLRLKMVDQTFIATAFYDTTISCDGNYFYHIDFKNLEGNVPDDNIYLKTLLYRSGTDPFDVNGSVTVYCPPAGNEKEIRWDHSGRGTIEYDLEWVFIDTNDNFTESSQQDAPFRFKEPVRITTPYRKYIHQAYYPDGRIWYRVRAVGYNPQYPDHRIPGKWFYPACGPSPIDNHQPDMNWQEQTVFAEEGKNKKVLNYFDGTMRPRQVQTNLSTEKVTLVAETLYDFEGRGSVSMLGVPATDNSLIYKPGFNVLESTDPVVSANTSLFRNKFHYDNYKLENGRVSDDSGAGQYYSANNASASIHKSYIPDSKGYVYSQTEYLNDASGRIARQSGVGEEFRMEGTHTTRYGYAAAAPEELIRLFGNNVGKAEHYRKNAVIDPNGQITITYRDQEDRVIATALAGESPSNVESLQSYKDLDPTPITINLGTKNKKGEGVSTISHKIMNVKQNTQHTFRYDLSAYGSDTTIFGCKTCTFELKISLTDPDGKQLDLSDFAGSDPVNTTKDYIRRNITAASCSDPTVVNDVQFAVLFTEIGDYTITKTLSAYDRSFEEMNTLLRQNETVQERIEQVENSVVVDEGNCEICTQACPEAEQVINEAIDEIAEQDCDNIYRQIENDLQQAYDDWFVQTYPDSTNEEIYVVPDSLIRKHPMYCKYELCVKDKSSAIFEKQIARAANWKAADSLGYANLLAIDPFFNDPNLSGYGDPKNDMQELLNNILIANIRGHTYSGPINEVTDPANTDYYVDENGFQDADGRHLLYLDLMGKKDQGMISESVYQAEISHSRWALYRGFYTEAKRQLKLTLTPYIECDSAKKELEQAADMPTTEEEMPAWGEKHYALTTDEATPDQIESSIVSLKMGCKTEFTAADTAVLKSHLRLYFKSSKKNFFRLILKRDLQANNPHLAAIQVILNKYGCNLATVALDDPTECANDTLIYVPDPIVDDGENTFTMMAASSSSEENPTPLVSPALLMPEEIDPAFNPDSVTSNEKKRLRALADISTQDSELNATMESTAIQPQLMMSMQALAAEDPAPSLDEWNALWDFYESTGGPSWVYRNGWTTTTRDPANLRSVKGWAGVQVDAAGHVTGLYYNTQNLNGTLPASLGDLTYLRSIYIYSNTYYQPGIITGQMPSTIGNLVNLTSLNISGSNNLTGPMPTSIGSLGQLTSLNLSGNHITDIPVAIAPLLTLTDLDLSTNPVIAFGSIVNLTNLNRLVMRGCQLTVIPDEITNLVPNLTTLDLSSNNFGTLPEAFSQMTSLVSLTLSGCGLTSLRDSFLDLTALNYLNLQSNQLATLPTLFGSTFPELTSLNLSFNRLTSLPAAFGQLESLVYLTLYYNQLPSLPEEFANLVTLQQLDAARNLLASLPVNFGHEWTAMTTLHLDYNRLTGLPDAFGEMSNLTSLFLNDNLLASLPLTFGDLTKLVYLELSDNLLPSLPSTFGVAWTSLTTLVLTNNKLTGLPDAFHADMPALQYLYLNNNLLTALPAPFGTSWANVIMIRSDFNSLTALPANFGLGWTKLQNIYLNNNQLASVPEVFGPDWTAVRTITLDHNQLVSFPDSFANNTWPFLNTLQLNNNLLNILNEAFGVNWPALQYLYLHYNQLGTLPSTFGTNWSQLQYLYLHYNVLTALPATFSTKWANLRYLQLDHNNLASLPNNFGDPWSMLNAMTLQYNQLTELPATFGTMWNALTQLQMDHNALTSLPSAFGDGLAQLRYLYINNNQLATLPTSFYKINKLQYLELSQNQLSITIPEYFGTFTSLSQLYLNNNKLMGSIPASVLALPGLYYLYLQVNQLSGHIPVATSPTLRYFFFSNNNFTFSDILEAKQNFPTTPSYFFGYYPQNPVDIERTWLVRIDDPITFTTNVDRATDPASVYRWYRTTTGNYNGTPVTPAGADKYSFNIAQVTEDYEGAMYYYTVTNAQATSLILYSKIQTIDVDIPKSVTLCTEFGSNETIDLFSFKVEWDSVINNCKRNLLLERQILQEYAVEKLIEAEMSTFYNKFRTNCFERAAENLKYSYRNIEHHYTLQYYDQAGNLVQTVPPQGVRLLDQNQINLVMGGGTVNHSHSLTTRYKYNVQNKLIESQTPDAGQSLFVYDKKGQGRLSQNAQQRLGNRYSYTRFDDLGRLVESGEMETTDDLNTLRSKVDSASFPESGGYALSDIVRAHYDFAKDGMQQHFRQLHLRGNVSYVEVLDKDQTDTTATYYSYDVHGNVTSIVQQLPGLDYKRTDYVYDVIGGNVNYVMYQYDQKDEFIHRYTYDSDSKIESVYTSTDGFIWDKEARYRYYLHGALARIELGEYNVQGIDYFQTLQGWTKGVNGFIDPGGDGVAGSLIPKDEFGFSLGYYQGDYSGIGLGAANVHYQQPMQHYAQLMGNQGLYNSNISWMSTDLKQIGAIKGDRKKGTQALLYRYDQLNRIVESRSLTQFNGTSGFAARTADPSGFDEDYSYDANGNLLTLQRRNEQAAITDNFNYSYYRNTNKLRQLIPVLRDTTYDGGAITSNHKVYRTIRVNGSAYVPAGSNVVLKATDSVMIHNDFDVADDANFNAYVLPEEEGVFLYDAIGNLIWDQEEGVKISWTPTGKVREIIKGDTTTISFRYDGSGNRIEKKVVRPDTTYVTHYVRDASGNVMGVYYNDALAEQSIYGIDRLGMYRTGRRVAHRTLGTKNYELNNHLDNVLVVITDNILANADSTWTKVVSASDYYPFGLTMQERSFDDDTYRYGFNGKEKDSSGEWGSSTAYDYGFRIYNPTIGRFLSVDPLANDFPSWSPYPFAMNRPIDGVDQDGLERVSVAGKWSEDNQQYLHGSDHAVVNPNVELIRFKYEVAPQLKKQNERRILIEAMWADFKKSPYFNEYMKSRGYYSDDKGKTWMPLGQLNPVQIEYEVIETVLSFGTGKVVRTGIKEGMEEVAEKTAKSNADELVHVYRAVRYSEAEIFERTGFVLSDAAAKVFNETGDIVKAFEYSKQVQNKWINTWWDNFIDYTKAHALFGTEMAGAFNLERTLISVTTDPAKAKYFAKQGSGIIFEGMVPRSQLVKQVLETSTESEYLLQHGTNLLKKKN